MVSLVTFSYYQLYAKDRPKNTKGAKTKLKNVKTDYMPILKEFTSGLKWEKIHTDMQSYKVIDPIKKCIKGVCIKDPRKSQRWGGVGGRKRQTTVLEQ